ncbi:MAG: bifunctional acetate--CoA ligase family protein/GNAT family N-acetyltransferase [Parvibaculum sp.]
MTIRNLNALFDASSVVLVGASAKPGSLGHVLLRNLAKGGFGGTVMAVNPRAAELGGKIDGIDCYAAIADLPMVADLAVISTPPQTVPALIDELGRAGTRAAVVITAGFGELGEEGRRLQQEMLDAAKPHLLRIVGPNCLGVMAPQIGLNASFCHIAPPVGDVAFISQSGAVVTGVVDWAAGRGIGFSKIVSLGAMSDVDFGDLLDYFASDVTTRAVVLYVESVTHASKFMSAARAVSRLKPVIVIKAGRSEAGAKAAASHTGALAGSDEVYVAAFRRAGMLRAQGLDELFEAVEVLRSPKGRRLQGERLGILTNGGGIGVLASDFLQETGGILAELSPSTIAQLDTCLPRTWSHGNPIDIIGDAPGTRYEAAVKFALEDPGVDALLAINCPTAAADNVEAARAVISASRESNKPVLTCWLGDQAAQDARHVLNEAGFPTFETAGQAVHAFSYLVRHRRNQMLLQEVPPVLVPDPHVVARVRPLIEAVLAEGRSWLSEVEAKFVLDAYGIPVTPTEIVLNEEAASEAASRMGYPVALKVLSKEITHKSDIGGVALNLLSQDAVRQALRKMKDRISTAKPDAHIEGFVLQPMVQKGEGIELILGLARDAVFGPVLLFGQGGTAVEVLNDKAIALPPLNAKLVADLVSRTRVSRLLKGYRHVKPVDEDALSKLIMAVGNIAADFPEILELDINPLLASSDGFVALDARIKVGAAAVSLPGEHFAIRPYPQHLETSLADRAGKPHPVRPIRPNDAPLLEAFVAQTNADDLRFRFLSALKRLPGALVARLTQIDYAREMAFVLFDKPDVKPLEILGVGRLSMDPDGRRAEYAVLVRSDCHGTGLGYALMQHVISYARSIGVGELFGIVIKENGPMLAMCEELGFVRHNLPGEPGLYEVVLKLSA